MFSQKLQQLFYTCKRSTYLRWFLQLYLGNRSLWSTRFNYTPFVTAVSVLSGAKCLILNYSLTNNNFYLFMASTSTYGRMPWLIMKAAHATIVTLFWESRMRPLLTQLSYLLFLIIGECCVVVLHVDASYEVDLFLQVSLLKLIVSRKLVSELLFEKVCNLLFNWVINHLRGSSKRTVRSWIRSSGQFNASASTSILFLRRKF